MSLSSVDTRVPHQHEFSLGALSPWRLLELIDRSLSWMPEALAADRLEDYARHEMLDSSPLATVMPREELASFRRMTLRP